MANSAEYTRGSVGLKVLVDDTAGEGFAGEHGLSFWIECAGGPVIFDTGQSSLVIDNARRCGVDPAEATAVVLSHGHYDHTGGLGAVLDVAPRAAVYSHPAAAMLKYGRKRGSSRVIGMPAPVKEAIDRLAGGNRIVSTQTPTEVAPGLFATGEIPMVTDFEDPGDGFFTDSECRIADTFIDDQAVFFDSPNGLVVLLGCAHRGVANTLHYAARLSGRRTLYAVIGGMHLLHASPERIRRTIEVFRGYDVRKIGLAHCTGDRAVDAFESAFPERSFRCPAGTSIDL